MCDAVLRENLIVSMEFAKSSFQNSLFIQILRLLWVVYNGAGSLWHKKVKSGKMRPSGFMHNQQLILANASEDEELGRKNQFIK